MAKIIIVGTGAMALFFGGRLAAAGEEITFLGTWEEGIQAINDSGIRVAEGNQDKVFPALATTDLDTLDKFSIAIVLVKSWQTNRAADQLFQVLNQEGIVLTLQNGLGNAEILKSKIGDNLVIQGVTTYGATLLDPGYVKPAGEGTIIVEEKEGIQPLIEILMDSGLSVKSAPSLDQMIWEKLAINAAINPITALLGVKNGDLLDVPAAMAIMEKAALEVIEVAQAQGFLHEIKNPLEIVEAVAASTAENMSSMLQDINRGAQTEIESVCGAVTRLGRKFQIPTPVNETLLDLIKARVSLDGGG